MPVQLWNSRKWLSQNGFGKDSTCLVHVRYMFAHTVSIHVLTLPHFLDSTSFVHVLRHVARHVWLPRARHLRSFWTILVPYMFQTCHGRCIGTMLPRHLLYISPRHLRYMYEDQDVLTIHSFWLSFFRDPKKESPHFSYMYWRSAIHVLSSSNTCTELFLVVLQNHEFGLTIPEFGQEKL
jgi:hypothetical protein